MTSRKRLFSELDMLKVNAAAFSAATGSLGLLKGLELGTRAPGVMNDVLDVQVQADFVDSLKVSVDLLTASLVALELPVALAEANRLKAKIHGGVIGHRELFQLGESIQMRLQDELGTRFLLSLNKTEAAEFAADNFGDEVHAKFPSIVFELDEASKCMALGRYTAAVFHWMRSVESALRAVRLCLGATDPLVAQGRNWGSILKELREMRTGASPKWPENDYFSGIYASIEAVMHAWRNSTMHIENKYTREEAESIRDCVKALLQRVAGRMDEQGMPLA